MENLHCWRQTLPLRRSVADRSVRRPSWIVDRKTSVEESPVAVHGTAPLCQCMSVPICVVATLMSLATAGKGPLPIASVKKHQTSLADSSALPQRPLSQLDG